MSKRTSDAAKRVSDTYNLHRIAAPYDSIGKWFAVKLTDGSSDNVLYDSKSDAASHQHHMEMYYAFIHMGPHSMTPEEAEVFLAVQRRAHSLGILQSDPNNKGSDHEMIPRLTKEDQRNQLRSIFVGDRPPSNISYRKG